MVPSADDVATWIAEGRRRGFAALRTTALFPESRPAFLGAGFVEVDRLALLALDLRTARLPRGGGTRRLRRRDLPEASAVDRDAFGDHWGNDTDALDDIGSATPHHRSRAVGRAPILGFAISGRAGRTGYVQRLAVRPDHQGRGVGGRLLIDALSWMARHAVETVLVNTGADNDAALALYRSAGFRPRPDELVVLERPLTR